MDELPALVARVHEAARRAGFPLTRAEAGPDRPSACLPGVGRFLAMLAAGCSGGRIGELGTGAGVGTSWMASAMPASCALITAELDERLAAVARELFAGDRRVEVLTGDALGVMSGRGPFDLLFADSGVKRRFFAAEPRLFSTEVVLPDLENSLLVGTRTTTESPWR